MADLLDRISKLSGDKRALLEALLKRKEGPARPAPVLDEPARHALVYEWNDTAADYPRDACLHELFAVQAARAPEAVAAVFGGVPLSYGDLDRRAGLLARRLAEAGVEPGDRVALLSSRSNAMMAGLLGILKAGGAYVPLDPAYPSERLAFLLEDSRPAVLLVEEGLADLLPEPGIPVLGIDHDSPEDPDAAPLSRPVPAESLAYVIYTSGSTGRPKGVAVTHRGVCRLVLGSGFLPLGPEDRIAQTSSASFDAATFEIWGALLNGASLVGFATEEVLSPPELARAVAAQGITVVSLTSAWFHRVAWEAPGSLAGLRGLVAGGETVDPRAFAAVLAAGAPERLIHAYGPTENTTFSSTHLVRRVPPGVATLPIGRAIGNSRLLVLDDDRRPVPVETEGELYVGGDGLAQGYFGRPDLTAERFVPDPLGEPGGRLYATGDRARWLPPGEVEFLGRRDGQLKIRGFRIEAGEVEAALGAEPGVAEAAVVAQGESADRRLVAFVVPLPGAAHEDLPEALRTALQKKLPAYLVPAAIGVTDKLPLTPNGKVNRRALALRKVLPVSATRPVEEPRNPIEQRLAGLFAEVLGHERVCVNESFFQLGGHSLLATRLISRVRAAFEVDLPLRAVFEDPTVAGLAARLSALGAERGEARSEVPPLAPVPRNGPLPLSFAQQRLWFLDRLQPGSSAYNMPLAVRLTGRLDAPALARSLAEVVRRHESLRTTFAERGAEPEQIVHPPGRFALPAIDLSDLPSETRQSEAARLIEEDARRPFDLEQGPLFRPALIRLGAREHRLLSTFHHIASDGWSMGVFVREMAALYPELLAGRPSPLPELPVQYADFAAWQRRWLQGEVLAAEIAHWRERLDGAPAVLEMPTDRPRPARWSGRGGEERFSLPLGLAAAVRALALREAVTPFMILLAAFQTLLARWSNRPDVCVGTPVAGRNQIETEGLIGFFVNTLVMRATLGDDPSGREALVRTRETALDAYAHQDLPFERLVEELAPERSLAVSPLFQATFALQNAPRHGLSLPDLTLEVIPSESGHAKFDLGFTLIEDADGGISGALGYAADLFDPPTVRRLLASYERLLAGLMEDPARRLSGLSLLTEAERHLLVSEWNDTASRLSEPPRPAHEWITEAAARYPDAVALIYQTERRTYAEMERESTRLARRLAAAGVGPERIVGICLEPSCDLLIAMLAVWKAGAAYLPLDPGYPADRLAYMVADSRVEIVIGERKDQKDGEDGRDSVLPGSVRVIGVNEEGPEAEPLALAGVDNLAYVIYTSGSTGRPKGVAITHRGIGNLIASENETYGLGPGDRALLFASFSFDGSVYDYLAALGCGAAVVLADRLDRMPGPGLVRLLQEQEVTWAAVTPTAMAAVPDAELPKLAILGVGSEACPAEMVTRWAAGRRFFNLYGPTEMTAVVLTQEWTEEGAPPIGRPILNTRALVLDRWLAPTPLGAEGELYLAGLGIARGYLGRPELTAERFLPDPWSPVPGGRFYRTGDRVRLRRDGRIDYLGRIDQQVKIRGFRIELGEIEAALVALPGVREAAVLVREPRPGDKRLAAYVVGEPGLTAAALRAELEKRLPDHMVPSGFAFVDRFPLTPSRKLDRAVLGKIEPEERTGGTDLISPRTPAEEILAGIWSEVLGVERIGVNDDFFGLSGHSLLATRVVARVREAFGVEIPLRRLFERATLGELARDLEALVGSTGTASSAPAIVPVPRDRPLPASFYQEFGYRTAGIAKNSIQCSLRLRGQLDLPALRHTLDELMRRHESLRTSFREENGEIFQEIAPPSGMPLPVIDLAALPEERRAAALQQLAADYAGQEYDLTRGPLFVAELVRMSEEDHGLLLNIHHIISDGWSVAVLQRELTVLYSAFATGRPSPLPPLPVQFADFAWWQRELHAGEALATQLAWWLETLADPPPSPALPLARPRPAVLGPRTHSADMVIQGDSAAALRALARSNGCTVSMLLLAAANALLHRYSGEEDLIINTIFSARNRPELSGLVGLLMNTIPVRTDLSGRPTFRTLLHRVRDAVLAGYSRQEVPFPRVLAELFPGRPFSRTLLSGINFNFLQFEEAGAGPNPPTLPGGLRATLFPAADEIAKQDLLFNCRDTGDALRCQLVGAADLFLPERMAALAADLETLLKRAAASPDEPLELLLAVQGTLPEPPRQSFQ